MPSPTSALSTLRPDLGDSFMEYDLAMQQAGYIANRVLPVFETMKQSGPFGKIPIEQLLQNREVSRAPGAGYSRSKFTFTTDTFACEEYGAEEPVDDREAAMYAEYFDAEVISTLRARQAVMDAAEKRVADLIFNSTTWTGAPLTSVITNEWDDFTNATPIVDVAAAVKLVWAGSGLWPNALIINRRVFKNLKQCDDIIAAIASSGAGFAARQADITEAQLAAVFDLDMIIVAGTPKNTADAGQAATIAPIWSDEYAMVAKVSVSQDIREPCLGRMFHWGGDGSSVGGTVESYRDETVRADIIRYRHDVDEKVLLTEAGHLLSNVTT